MGLVFIILNLHYRQTFSIVIFSFFFLHVMNVINLIANPEKLNCNLTSDVSNVNVSYTRILFFVHLCFFTLFFGGGVATLPSSCSEEVNNVRHTLNNISLKSCFSVPATIFTDCSVQLSSCVITDIPTGVRKECQIASFSGLIISVQEGLIQFQRFICTL